MDYTVFTAVKAEEFNGSFKGDVKGTLNGALGSEAITSAVDVTLTDAQKKPVIAITLSAASKTVTLGLADGGCAIVANVGGTNAFTLKNVSGDSGSSIAAGKVALVIASTTANSTKVYVLN